MISCYFLPYHHGVTCAVTEAFSGVTVHYEGWYESNVLYFVSHKL